MRTQITVYLSQDAKQWLAEYAAQMNLKESEVVKCLIERERQVKWLQWALQQSDPEQGDAPLPPEKPERSPPSVRKLRKKGSDRRR